MTPQDIQRRTQRIAVVCGIVCGVGYLAFRVALGMIALEANQDPAWLTFTLALHLFIGSVIGYSFGLWLAIAFYSSDGSTRLRQLLGLPLSAQVRNQAGCAYHAQGAHVAAIAEFNEAICADPKFAIAYSNRAACNLELEKLDDALADLNEAIRLNSGFPEPYSGRANIFIRQGKLDWARQDLERCLELKPNHAVGHCLRGQLRIIMGDVAGALVDYDRAIAIGVVSADLFSARGQAEMTLDQVEAALADFERALALTPGHPASLAGRGMIWILKGDFGRALQDIDQAIRGGETNAVAFNNRGFAQLHRRSYAEAKADFLEAIRLDPKHPNAFKNLAWLQATCPQSEHRNGSEAVANATQALELVKWKEAPWLEILAAAHAEAGNFDEAVRWQEKFLAGPPGPFNPQSQARLQSYKARQAWREPGP